MIHKFLNSFLENIPEDNLVGKIFKNKYNEIMSSNERYAANKIMQKELKHFFKEGEYNKKSKNEREDITEASSFISLNSDKKLYLSEISVKGIRGIPFIKESCSKNHECNNAPMIDLKSNESAIIFGWNGEGKSSFVQGIEYGLTGEVEEAKRRNKSNEVDEFLTNNFVSKGIVDIELYRPYCPKKVLRIKRSSNAADNLTIEYGENSEDIGGEFENHLDKIQDYYKKVFIEKNRIEEFVLAKGKKQLKRYEDLIGLKEIDNFFANKWRYYQSERKQDLYNHEEEKKKN